VGPGRGSAAGSLVSYLLNITTLDPLEHGLLFERFLNPDRITMPDIDMDFADTRRDEVLEYVRQKYGVDRVIQICTFGTLAARAAVKDTGRVFGVPFVEMNELVKLISERPGTELSEALESEELRTFVESNETYKKIMDIALKLEGKARHVSVHACGVIITPEPAVHYTALQHAPKDETITITQYDAKPLEALGLVKMDFLGLKNLTIIQTALEIIERMHGIKIDIQTIPTDDKETFALLSRAETTGVFQLESGGMRRYLKQLKPSMFDDITAMVSLYRPGPMEKIPDYIKGKHGTKEVKYLHTALEPILKPTYGVGIYQEQILEMARVFAGFSLGEADLLRRAIGKKIKHELDAQREKFIEGTVKQGYKRDLGVTLFDDVITPFANYGFNKSHGASYARIAYETAYLKAHYPTEFMAALLSSENGDTDRISIEIAEARAMGIRVLPPDINESLAHFTALPEKAIRFGLTAIKGVGESSVRQIIALRDEGITTGMGRFTNLEDFARRVPAKILNKKTLEALAKSGALDSLGERGTLVQQYDKIADFSKSSGDVGSSQEDLFGGLQEETEAVKISFESQAPATPHEKLAWEKETLGLFVSSHPLAGLTKYISKKAQLIRDLKRKDVNKKIALAGILESVKTMRTKKGEAMAILTIEDPTGSIEVTLFPKTYAQAVDFLTKPDTLLVIGGTLDSRGGQLQVRADAIKRSVLSTVVERAKSEGFFDEKEAEQGISRARSLEEDEEPREEEVIERKSSLNGTGQLLGPLAQWILDGMNTKEPLQKLHLDADVSAEPTSDPAVQISIHTIELPAQASKQLLMDLKSAFEKFPGKERIQLKIGEKIVPVPMTVTISAILENRIEKILEKYAVEV
jgi:DNA polymerase-3 subunit alpha